MGSFSASPHRPLHWAAHKVTARFSQSETCKGARESKKQWERESEPKMVFFNNLISETIPPLLPYSISHPDPGKCGRGVNTRRWELLRANLETGYHTEDTRGERKKEPESLRRLLREYNNPQTICPLPAVSDNWMSLQLKPLFIWYLLLKTSCLTQGLLNISSKM